MLIDDNIFCGSLNISVSYSSVRYGEGSFRDLNLILKKHPTKKVRDFFKDIIITNAKYYPQKINPEHINSIFNEINARYANENELYERRKKDGDTEVCVFLEETPPNKTEVSAAVIDMIKKAQKNIKIV